MNNKDQRSTATDSLPPRRVTHRRKKVKRKHYIKEVNGERLAAKPEMTSDVDIDDDEESQGILEQGDKEVAASEVKKRFNGGLVFANIVLWLFLIMVGFILFYVMTM